MAVSEAFQGTPPLTTRLFKIKHMNLKLASTSWGASSKREDKVLDREPTVIDSHSVWGGSLLPERVSVSVDHALVLL